MTLNIKLHSAQSRIFKLRNKHRFRLVVCGRRWGKTYLGAVESIIKAVQGSRVWWVAPTHSVGKEGFRICCEILKKFIQENIITIKNSAPHKITFPSGGEIEWRTAGEARSLRGAGLDFLVLDEAAFVSSDIWYNALLPTLADKRGSALLITTPAGKSNWLYKLYQDNRNNEEWGMFSMPSWTNTMTFPGGENDPEIQTLRKLLPPEAFAQEIAAEWLDTDPGAVFRGWSKCIDGTIEKPYEGYFVFGIDLARKRDYTAIVVMDTKNRRVVYLERFKMSWEETVERIIQLAHEWRPFKIAVDATGVGDPIVETLQQKIQGVEGVIITPQRRQMMLEALRIAIEERLITFPRHDVLIEELDSFRIEIMRSGTMRYVSKAEHDDTVFALALAWEAAKTDPLTSLIAWQEAFEN